jgi:hypothetical protein
VSFVLEGRNGGREAWQVLDERHNVFELLPSYASWLFYVDVGKHYSMFRILQTHPSNLGSLQFSISGFEIHGNVKTVAPHATRTKPAAVHWDEFDS